MTDLSTKHASTLFLKAVIILMAALVFALCVFLLPRVWPSGEEGTLWEYPQIVLPGLLGLYASAIPFFIALYQAFKLLQYIDKNNVFSALSVSSLNSIKYCAIAMSACYAVCMPLVVLIAELDDAPGAAVIGLAFTCAPLVVATFAAVLQKLVMSAIAIKSEHDLTV